MVKLGNIIAILVLVIRYVVLLTFKLDLTGWWCAKIGNRNPPGKLGKLGKILD